MMNLMVRIKPVLHIVMMLPFAAALAGEQLSADEIMAKVDYANRRAFDTQLARVTFTTCRYRVAAGQVQCTEQLRTVIAESVKRTVIAGQPPTDRQMSIVHEPARDRGTALLVFEYEDRGRDNDNWIYLPALNKVNRVIANEDESGSVFGTEFSVETTENPEGRKLYEYTYEVLEETSLHGRQVWVMEIKPKPERARLTAYDKIVSWIDKETFLPLKEDLYSEGRISKQRTQSDIREVDGVFVVMKAVMNNLATSRISQMDKTTMRHNVDVPSEFLSHRGLTDFAYRERLLVGFRSELSKAPVAQ